MGRKDRSQEASVVTDNESGKVLTDPEDIKHASLKYCQRLLTNRKPKEEYESDIALKTKLHDIRMAEVVENDASNLTYQQFKDTMITLSKKHGNKYR